VTVPPVQQSRAVLPPEPAPIATRPPATAAVALAPIAANISKPIVPPSTIETDEALIHDALQRYRSAYEGLDAREARAVWPAVNEAALARAFDNLESQRLTFDACSVQLHGDDAVAMCRGTARYVPKIGSHEPRVEPRSWTFALRKAGDEWKIASARAER
jgi:hypothetical protein